jgi:hypothetical protein
MFIITAINHLLLFFTHFRYLFYLRLLLIHPQIIDIFNIYHVQYSSNSLFYSLFHYLIQIYSFQLVILSFIQNQNLLDFSMIIFHHLKPCFLDN